MSKVVFTEIKEMIRNNHDILFLAGLSFIFLVDHKKAQFVTECNYLLE